MTHNTLDYSCVYWSGDKRPIRGDERNTGFDGDPLPVDMRRCLICRPFSEEEEAKLLDMDGSATVAYIDSELKSMAGTIRVDPYVPTAYWIVPGENKPIQEMKFTYSKWDGEKWISQGEW